MMMPIICFEKFHGNGNDFIFLTHEIFLYLNSKNEVAEFVKSICDRHCGLGADGVIFFDDIAHRLKIFNSDASIGNTCGNALRCYGLKLLRQKLWDGTYPISINNFTDEIFATLLSGTIEQIEVGMGMERKVEIIPQQHLDIDHIVLVELANPHLVFIGKKFVDFTSVQYQVFGQWAQKEFADVNINMLSINTFADNTYQLCVYERGAGLTLCCGSGAVASRIALEAVKLAESSAEKINFNLPGGNLSIAFAAQQRTLIGPAKYICKGIFEWH